jgi:hypothetical protein
MFQVESTPGRNHSLDVKTSASESTDMPLAFRELIRSTRRNAEGLKDLPLTLSHADEHYSQRKVVGRLGASAASTSWYEWLVCQTPLRRE